MNHSETKNKSKNIKEQDIQKLSILRSFKPLLKRLHVHADCFNRKLHYDQYVSLTLLYFINPILTALRSIQQASTLKNVQDKLGIKRTSPWEASRLQDKYLTMNSLFKERAHLLSVYRIIQVTKSWKNINLVTQAVKQESSLTELSDLGVNKNATSSQCP